ncbi:hypothetical protein BJ912DRAFT_1054346 [Pholiota molesta]|nr:hypothetical protein BJ912DRAFT_1054346 [Pholiota molesta]
MKGITNLSCITGSQHDQICHFLLSLILNIRLPDGTSSARLVHAVRALLDFLNLARYPVHTSETLDNLDSALRDFHDNKLIFVDLGIRQNFNIPKLHYMGHYRYFFERFGSGDNFNTEYTEWLHIDMAKQAYRASNRKDEYPQMTAWLDRREKMMHHAKFIRRRLAASNPNHVHVQIPAPSLIPHQTLKLPKHPSIATVSLHDLKIPTLDTAMIAFSGHAHLLSTGNTFSAPIHTPYKSGCLLWCLHASVLAPPSSPTLPCTFPLGPSLGFYQPGHNIISIEQAEAHTIRACALENGFGSLGGSGRCCTAAEKHGWLSKSPNDRVRHLLLLRPQGQGEAITKVRKAQIQQFWPIAHLRTLGRRQPFVRRWLSVGLPGSLSDADRVQPHPTKMVTGAAVMAPDDEGHGGSSKAHATMGAVMDADTQAPAGESGLANQVESAVVASSEMEEEPDTDDGSALPRSPLTPLQLDLAGLPISTVGSASRVYDTSDTVLDSICKCIAGGGAR